LSKPKSKKSHLPKVAPKRTGKRLPRPEDPIELNAQDILAAAGEEEELLEPEQGRLPEMDDAAIEEIESVARKYVKLRDARMRILKEEVEQKALLLQVMHRLKRSTYLYDDLEIEIVPTSEKLKVRLKKDDEE